MSLFEAITRLPAVLSVLSPWESCALTLIQKERPSTVSFFCDSAYECPDSNFYSEINVPSKTFFGLEIQDLPDFSGRDLVFVALKKDQLIWVNQTVDRYRMGGKNSFKMILVMNLVEGSADLMEALFRVMWKSGVVRSGVILKNASTSQVYTYVPFRPDGVCGDTRPLYLGECSTASETVFDVTYKILNLNNCPIRFSYADDNPWILKNPVSGRIGFMVKELATRLNFSIVTTTPLKDRNGGVCGPAEYTGSKGDVVHDKADIAVGLFNRQECGTMNYVGLPHMNSLTWCAPVLSEKHFIFVFLLQILQPGVWAAIVVSLVLVIFTVLTLRYVQNVRMPMSDAIYLAAIIFAPVPMKFRSFSEKMFIAAWLLSCLVLRALYEGQLKSKSAVPLGSHIITDLEELTDMNLKLCTTIANLQVLEGVNDPYMQFLTNRTRICEGGLFENLASAARNQDGAVLTSDLRCTVTAAEVSNKGPPLLYPLAGGRTKLFQFVPMVTLPGFPFNEMLTTILQRSYESGLVNIWIDTNTEIRVFTQVRRLALRNLLPPLFVLSIGCLAGFFILLIEYAYFQWPKLKFKISDFFKEAVIGNVSIK